MHGPANKMATLLLQAGVGEIRPQNGPPYAVQQKPKSSVQHATSGTAAQADTVWKPLSYSAKKSWSWIDWLRFLFYR